MKTNLVTGEQDWWQVTSIYCINSLQIKEISGICANLVSTNERKCKWLDLIKWLCLLLICIIFRISRMKQTRHWIIQLLFENKGYMSPRDLAISDKMYYLKISQRFESAKVVLGVVRSIWTQQQGCIDACQIWGWYANSNIQNSGFETLRDPKIGYLIRYWNRPNNIISCIQAASNKITFITSKLYSTHQLK